MKPKKNIFPQQFPRVNRKKNLFFSSIYYKKKNCRTYEKHAKIDFLLCFSYFVHENH